MASRGPAGVSTATTRPSTHGLAPRKGGTKTAATARNRAATLAEAGHAADDAYLFGIAAAVLSGAAALRMGRVRAAAPRAEQRPLRADAPLLRA